MRFLTIESPIRWLFLGHAVLGTLALLFFLVPLLSKKGSKLHIRTGWIYTVAMISVSISAYIITPWRGFWDSGRTTQSQSFALFLAFIATLTLSCLWNGLVVLKAKKRQAPSREISHIGPPFVLIIFGLIVMITGIKMGSSLLVLFPILGLLVGKLQLKYWLSTPSKKMHWWYFHMSGMFTACIATITAFLVTAVPRIWPYPIFDSPVLWIAPGLILGQILKRWTASYERQFGDT